ncbi:Succinyl-diaminopimelate desuccinylase [Fundidesulfovibrio magnetotacticus]|uniref:Succinyl-diaminopimelate desuccinylase n=1 Tax=Fundidesulfovibrio magnetotacticus TaxID=2730080 RepID=A0A6V8LYS4_9BACT|nr:M20 family metallo-hydrolase [Fundidesulfovibrio magnetotacticus]GFK95159.1 Succinyl-diaminopimelate desuccinylase [Fundidesulfovibrio magnetotacticus]
MPAELLRSIAASRDVVVNLQRAMVAIPAVGPDNGGHGERAKADFMLGWLAEHGITDVEEFRAPDRRVPCGHRPSIKAVVPGKDASRTLWVISHLDVVPPGDPTLWTGDPFEMVLDGEAMVGRGVEDNHQGVVASLLVAKGLVELGITPPVNYGVLLVADEENGSKYGLDWLLKNHPELFGGNDLYIIPDFGIPSSEMVEVAEKSMLWLKITLSGKQCHASSPEEGVNTLVASAAFILRLTKLHDRFPAVNELFKPANSTFQPTKKEANVENVNTIPGRDVFYIDCRVLPQYDLDDVLEAVYEMGREICQSYGVTAQYDLVQKEQAAPATPKDAPVVRRVLRAVKEVYGGTPRPMGVGGGTVAAYLRRAGLDAVVWATWTPNAHQPNERSLIKNNIGDAQVIARALFDQQD